MPDCGNFKLTLRIPGATINYKSAGAKPSLRKGEKAMDSLRKDGRTAERCISGSSAVFPLRAFDLKRREVNIYEYCEKGLAGKT
jgi:hypothetical protein